MANTLYLVDDDFVSKLPKSFRATMVSETQKLFSSFNGFTVKLEQPSKFPTKYDFTDSVVRVTETDGEVGAVHNLSVRTQLKNIQVSAKKNGVTMELSPATHNPGTPERGGVGFQIKEVLTAGDKKLAMVLTGGVASLATVKEAVVEHAAEGRSKAEILKARKQSIEGTPTRKGLGSQDYYKSPNANRDAKGLSAWEMLEKPIADWPADMQKSAATALARVIAHEARHQYIAPHYNGGGLGAGEAAFWGDKNFEHFDEGDLKEVKVALEKFTRLQRTATVHLETNPADQPFPF